MSECYTVLAKRWDRGWELHIEGVGVTQSKTLSAAETQARDYISLLLGIPDGATINVVIRAHVGRALDADVLRARTAVARLAEQQRTAAALSRATARKLAESGLSGADIAVVLAVSRQRVSQLINS